MRRHFPQVNLIDAGSNLGFGAANNLGLRRALDDGATHILLLNQDAWIEPGAIETLVAAFDAAPSLGVVSPMHLDGTGRALDWNFSTFISPIPCPDLVSDLVCRRDRSELKSVYEVAFVNAAAWMMSRECVECVGGFDPVFPHYGEDEDYIDRVRFHGFKVAICPAATICHDRQDRAKKPAPPTVQRQCVQHLIYLKKLKSSLARRAFDVLKSEYGGAVRAGLGMKPSRVRFHLGVATGVLAQLNRLRRHRTISRTERGAFLPTA